MSAPFYADDAVTLYHGDCLDVLRTLPDASVHAVVTDPPYGISFMGREWDQPGRDGSTRRGGSDRPFNAGPVGKDHRTTTERSASMHAGKYDLSLSANQGFGRWCEAWATECLRVLKPGGHLLAFGGTRTWHRLACAVEDAGFEMRDSIAWLYGSGFAKSHNLSNLPPEKSPFCTCPPVPLSHDRAGDLRGMRDDVSDAGVLAQAGQGADLLANLQRGSSRSGVGETRGQGRPSADPGELCVGGGEDARPGESSMEGRGHTQAREGQLQRSAVRPLPAGVPADGAVGRLHLGASARDGAVGRSVADAGGVCEPHQPRPLGQPAGELGPLADERGPQARRGWPLCGGCGKQRVVGLGTALKPAHEPIVVARKPLSGTVAATVLAHGTGALNVDGCRVGTSAEDAKAMERANSPGSGRFRASRAEAGAMGRSKPGEPMDTTAGRWPANVVLDPDSAAELDRQSGTLTSGKAGANGHVRNRPEHEEGIYGGGRGLWTDAGPVGSLYGDSGGASRFFPTFRYEPKAPAVERPRDGATAHPTVKPLDLMRWLVRLVTPPGGTVLEPFAGSGTTAEACVIEGFRCIAIEREAAYLPLIVARLSKPIQPDLFGGAA